jgi:SAM-dependent methyltransferase
MARTASLARSVTLFRAFLREQTDPDLFYGVLARDSVEQLAEHARLDGRTVLDVGGGPGYFADAFRGAGATYVGLEPDAGEMVARGAPQPGTVRASGEALPVRNGSVDVCYSSNVLEHVRRPWTMTAEMVRVTRTGGIVFLSFTPWWSPWGGFGESLFPVSVGAALRWARRCPDAEVVATFPRYHPWWARWVVAVPLLREVVSWNLVVVLRKK